MSKSLFAALALACSFGCAGGNPTSPSGDARLSLSCVLELDGYQCSAYTTDASGSTQRDVSGLASWTTSDTSIARVTSVGFVTVLRAGQAAIRASYQGTAGFLTMDLRPGGSRVDFRTLSGWVIDSRDKSKIPGVAVRIIGGPNAGRTTTTGADGAYQLYDLEPGALTVVFSKPGFATVSFLYSLPGDRFVSLDATMDSLVP